MTEQFDDWMNEIETEAASQDAEFDFKPLDEGWHSGRITSCEAMRSSQKQTPGLKFRIRAAFQYREVVDENGDVVQVPINKQVFHTVWFPEYVFEDTSTLPSELKKKKMDNLRLNFAPLLRAVKFSFRKKETGEDPVSYLELIADQFVGKDVRFKAIHGEPDTNGNIWPGIDVFEKTCHGVEALPADEVDAVAVYFTSAQEAAEAGSVDDVPF